MTLKQKIARQARLKQTPEWKALIALGRQIGEIDWNQPVPSGLLDEFEKAHEVYQQRAAREPRALN